MHGSVFGCHVRAFPDTEGGGGICCQVSGALDPPAAHPVGQDVHPAQEMTPIDWRPLTKRGEEAASANEVIHTMGV